MVTLKSVFYARKLISLNKLNEAFNLLYDNLSSIRYIDFSKSLNSLILLQSQYHHITKDFLEQLVEDSTYRKTISMITKRLLILCDDIENIVILLEEGELDLSINFVTNLLLKRRKQAEFVELVIQKSLYDYTIEEKDELFSKISSLLSVNGGQIIIKEIIEGSIIIRFNLSKVHFKILNEAFLEGVFYSNKVQRLTLLTDEENINAVENTKSNTALANNSQKNSFNSNNNKVNNIILNTEVIELMEKGLFKEATKLYQKHKLQ